MPFPTHEETAAFAWFTHYNVLERLFRQRAPEYAQRIERPDGSPQYLKIRLGEPGTGVVLAWTRTAWTIVDPRGSAPPRLWDPDTPDEVLVDALRARVAACLTGQPEPSPWRWDESSESSLTRLADLLTAADFDVTSVVVGNRAVETGPGNSQAALIGIAARSDGDFVRARRDQLEVNVARKPTLGWVADIWTPGEPHWRRLDLQRLLKDLPSTAPGIAADSVDLLALASALAAGTAELLSTPGTEPSLSPVLAGGPLQPVPPRDRDPTGYELAAHVAAQLHAIAFGDVEVRDDPVTPLRSGVFHIVWRGGAEDTLGGPDLKCLYADAAVAGKPLLIISAGHVTRPALAFADKAKAFVFRLDPRQGLLWGGNARSEEAYLTDWSDWIKTSDHVTRVLRPLTVGGQQS